MTIIFSPGIEEPELDSETEYMIRQLAAEILCSVHQREFSEIYAREYNRVLKIEMEKISDKSN